MSIRPATLAVALLALGAMAAPAHATTTIATYSASSVTNLVWRRATNKTGGSLYSVTTAGGNNLAATPVTFSLLVPGDPAETDLDALLTISAIVPAGTPSTLSGGSVAQTGLSGTFSFIYDGPGFTEGSTTYSDGANLLTGTFTDADITGVLNSKAAVLEGTADYTSDLLDFTGASSETFSINLGPIGGKLVHTAGQAIRTFRGIAGSGSFSSDVAVSTSGNPSGPINLPPLGGVPEPATWAMMLVGIGGLGAVLRGQRKKALATAA